MRTATALIRAWAILGSGPTRAQVMNVPIAVSIAMAALFTAHHLKVKAIAALTQSGSTALWISRLNSGVPIYALTPEIATRYRLSLYRDVFPLMISYHGHELGKMLEEAEQKLVEAGVPVDMLNRQGTTALA